MQKLPYTVAHRGLSASFPENTARAFQESLQLNVDWIELDVIMTADDIVIVSHDTTAERCTDGSGAFRLKSLKEVKMLDAGSWFATQFVGERIPTLNEVIDMVEPTTTRLCIEIKGDAPEDYLVNARATVSLLRERQFLRQVSLSSFDPGCLIAIREWEPRLSTNFDPTPQDGTLSAWELCQQCLVAGANFISHKYETLMPELIEEARSHGLAVWAWTVNDEEAMRQMAALEVDAILTDDAAQLQRILAH